LILSALFAYEGGRYGKLIIFAVPAVLVFLFLLKNPQFGLISLIPVALLVPFELATGQISKINIIIIIVAFLLGLWVFDMVVFKRQIQLSSGLSTKITIVFMVFVLLSLLIGNLPWLGNIQGAPISAQIAGAVIFFLSLGVFLLVSHQVRDIRWIERMVWFFLFLGGIFMVTQRLSFGGFNFRSLFQYTATRGVFWTWLVALAFSQSLVNDTLRLPLRVLLIGLVVITIYFGLFVFRGWISGWLPPLVSVLMVLWLTKPRFALGITAVIILSIALNWDFIYDELLFSGTEYTRNWWSLVTRQEAWKIVIENIISRNPLFGVGPSNYYYYVSNIPIFGYYVPFNSHQQYLDIVAQTGVLGLFCFILFFIEIFRIGFHLLSKKLSAFSKAYVIGIVGGLIGVLVSGFLADWIIPFVYNVGLAGFRASYLTWLFIGGLVVIERIYQNGSRLNIQYEA